MFTKIVLKLTHRIWNRHISTLLCRAYTERVINSRQMHILASLFDPTQENRAKPTVRELEDILSGEDVPIEILPNGEMRVMEKH